MKFYKSLLFLFIFNLLILGPVGGLWGLPAVLVLWVPLLTVDGFVLLAPGFYLKRFFKFSYFPKEDFYGLHKAFDDLKPKDKHLQLLKANKKTGICMGFWTKKGVTLALSEDILESLCFKDIQQLLRLFFSMKEGDFLFLTLLSGFLLMIEKIRSFFVRWLFLKTQAQSGPPESFVGVRACQIMSLMSRRLFWQADKNQPSKWRTEQALLLYRLDGLMKTRGQGLPLYCAPLFFVNPLTSLSNKGYTLFHPQVKDRIQGLIGRWPP